MPPLLRHCRIFVPNGISDKGVGQIDDMRITHAQHPFDVTPDMDAARSPRKHDKQSTASGRSATHQQQINQGEQSMEEVIPVLDTGKRDLRCFRMADLKLVADLG